MQRKAFLSAIESLSEPPRETEMNFALKATEEVENFAVGKLGDEANYSIRLVWTRAKPLEKQG